MLILLSVAYADTWQDDLAAHLAAVPTTEGRLTEGPAEWVWSEEAPHRADCDGHVLNEEKGWTVTIGGMPSSSMAQLGAETAYRRMPGCGTLVDIVLRYDDRPTTAWTPNGPVHGASRTVVHGKAPTRPSDCRTEEEGRQDVATANKTLERLLSEATSG